MRARQFRFAVSILGGAAIWEVAARLFAENALVIVPLSEIGRAFMRLAASGTLGRDVAVSLVEFAGGFALAGFVGIAAGLLMAVSTTMRDLMYPWISALNSMPVVAVSPLLIIAFGIGLASKIAVVFLVSVFPILINTLAGAENTEANLVDAARAYGANRWQVFQKVVLPSSMPYIVAGLRLGVARGLVGIVVGEMFGAQAGVGHLIMVSGEVFATADLYVGVIVLAVAGIVMIEVLEWLELRLAPWRVFVLNEPNKMAARRA